MFKYIQYMKTTKLVLAILFALLLLNTLSEFTVNSAPLVNVKDILNSSQLSYFNRLAGGIPANQSIVNLQTSANPSNTTTNLFVGDTISIGTTLLNNYIVSNVGTTAEISIGGTLYTGDNTSGLALVATRSAIHTISFTTPNQVTSGYFQILIKSADNTMDAGTTDSTGENSRNGIPDQKGFDLGADIGTTDPNSGLFGVGTRIKAGLGGTGADVLCPDIGTESASVGGTATILGQTFHEIKCAYTGNNAVGGTYTIVIGRSLLVGSQLINPSPGIGHLEGATQNNGTLTDVYSFYVRHLDASENVKDSTHGKIAVIEAVRVTATVDPTLTLLIDNAGVGFTSNVGFSAIQVGETRCGVPVSGGQSTTTGTAATFREIGIDAFNTVAQRLSVVTNAFGGYSLTAFQDKYMTAIGITAPGGVGVTIPPTLCNNASPCTSSAGGNWTTSTRYGFGYSLENIVGGTDIMSFNYNDAGDAFRARSFGYLTSSSVQVMGRTSTPQQTDRAYVCYRVTVGPAQPAGDYEGRIIYTTTATF